ncbi:glycosyl transferase [Sulfurifustis variabilis]|uniref:Glycosyl transferase n=1 Tax=Sulfurifustis variabilis TaxID=1675686 RepID=A0A1B4V3D1_9GAMM|nr:glycosyltransferase family 2 protein [Sulfurifustis variabilis]BAU48069.1 glycosyl transferase [Sulfurifustis variabilis]
MSTTRDVLVSVVIPTFNRAGLLPRVIRSVQAQTHPRLEIIVVDDGSTDNTQEIVDAIGDRRVRYVRHETNKGPSAARNTGIRAALGGFIAFLDSDVEWEPETVARQMGVLDRHDAVLCTMPGAVTNRYRHKQTVPLEDLRRGRFIAAGTSALMGRADALRDILFDEALWFAEDWDIVIRLAQKYSVGYLNQPLVRAIDGPHQRISNTRITRNMSARELEHACRMIRKHEAFLGPKWFGRHMCRILLAGTAGSRNAKEKMHDIAYAARQHGAASVAWVLGKRFLLRRAVRLQSLRSRITDWRRVFPATARFHAGGPRD